MTAIRIQAKDSGLREFGLCKLRHGGARAPTMWSDEACAARIA
jgi:hypothetical protein